MTSPTHSNPAFCNGEHEPNQPENSMWNPGVYSRCASHVRRQEDTSVTSQSLPIEPCYLSMPPYPVAVLEDGVVWDRFDQICNAACCRFEGKFPAPSHRAVISLERSLPSSLDSELDVMQPVDGHFAFGPLSWDFGRSEIADLLIGEACLQPLSALLALCTPTAAAWFRERSCRTACCLQSDLVCFTDGSFTPACDKGPALMGWAIAFFRLLPASEGDMARLGVAANSVPPCMLSEGDAASAFIAECCALSMAALASMIMFPARDVTFVGDCSSALGCAEGVVGRILESPGDPESAASSAPSFEPG